jgi:TRAP-type C4-dicarboxylate transport system substrate-binding protein
MLFVVSSPLHAEDVIKLRYSNFFPPVHKNSVLSEEWCKEIEKRTNGKVKISYFAGGTLTPPPQTYDSVTKGIADIGQAALAYSMGRFPLSEVVDYPLGYSSGVQATKLINAYYQKFDPQEFKDTKVLYMHAHGPGLFHTKNAVTKLDDVVSLRIRATGTSAEIVKAIGATPVSMPITEAYDALSKGLVDGACFPIESLKGWKFADQTKFTIKNFGAAYTIGFYITMNKDKWAGLPADVQKVFMEVSREWTDKQGKMWDELDKEGQTFAEGLGCKFIQATPAEEEAARAKVRPLLDSYVQKTKAKNLPGDEVIKFCLDWLKANK